MDLGNLVGDALGGALGGKLDSGILGKIGDLAAKAGISKEDLIQKAIALFTKNGGDLKHEGAGEKVLEAAKQIVAQKK